MSTQETIKRGEDMDDSKSNKTQAKSEFETKQENKARISEPLIEEEHDDREKKLENKEMDENDQIKNNYDAKIKTLELEVQRCRQEYALTEAEIINLTNKTKKNVESARASEVKNFSLDILSVADSLQQALRTFEQNISSDNLLEVKSLIDGVKLTEKTLLDTFAKHGIQKIQCHGMEFDSNCHEVSSKIPTPEHTPGTVVKVFVDGYTLNKGVLRPAKVGVAASEEKENP